MEREGVEKKGPSSRRTVRDAECATRGLAPRGDEFYRATINVKNPLGFWLRVEAGDAARGRPSGRCGKNHQRFAQRLRDCHPTAACVGSQVQDAARVYTRRSERARAVDTLII